MSDEHKLESGFRVKNIILLDSKFNRKPQITFDDPEVKTVTDITIQVQVEDKVVSVAETLTFKRTFNDIEEVSCIISMIGLFEMIGESELNLEDFGRVNGAAMIYPYMREHFSNLSSKAGLGLIFLPPINLTKQG